MWELDYEESWALKNWCFWTVMLENTLESPLDCKEIQPVHLKADQSWVFFGRNDAEAGTPILWPPHEKSWLIGKDPDVGEDWRQEEKGATEDEMGGWHHWLSWHGFEQAGREWRTGKPGVLWFMRPQRAGHDLATEQQQQSYPPAVPVWEHSLFDHLVSSLQAPMLLLNEVRELRGAGGASPQLCVPGQAP